MTDLWPSRWQNILSIRKIINWQNWLFPSLVNHWWERKQPETEVSQVLCCSPGSPAVHLRVSRPRGQAVVHRLQVGDLRHPHPPHRHGDHGAQAPGQNLPSHMDWWVLATPRLLVLSPPHKRRRFISIYKQTTISGNRNVSSPISSTIHSRHLLDWCINGSYLIYLWLWHQQKDIW